jgi:group I intron endonuclease
MLQVLDPQGSIYALACLSERKLYIGSSVDFRTRLIAHKSDLRTGRHPNQPLQEAFDKFGEKSFRCWILADNKTNCGTCVLSDELLKSIGYWGGEWREYYVISSLPYQSTYNISKPYYSAALFKKAFVVTEDFGEVLKNLNEFV